MKSREEKYKQFPITNPRYPGDFSWSTFFSFVDDGSAIRAEEYIKKISECTNSETINLSGNNLYKNPKLLEQCVHAVQDSALIIDLSFNQLHKLSQEDWDRLCAALPEHIVELNLSNNKLGQLDVTLFQHIIDRIPNTVSDILLYNTHFTPEFQTIISSHGNRIKTGRIPETRINLDR